MTNAPIDIVEYIQPLQSGPQVGHFSGIIFTAYNIGTIRIPEKSKRIATCSTRLRYNNNINTTSRNLNTTIP
eukprot:COSAG01_NODE_4373_length_5087_cov_14.679230_3_plen_72_part_00